MQLTPYQKRQLKIVAILVLGIPLTIFAVYKGVQYLSKAGTEAVPKDVIVTNLTTNSLTVTWFTDIDSDGYVVPVLNGVEQSPVRDKRGEGKRTSHYVELKSLEPNTKYSFLIVSGGKKYSGQGTNEYVFTTAPVGVDTPVPNPVHGSVEGTSADSVVIYVFLKNKSAYPVSSTIPSGANWIVDLSSFRKISDKSMLKVTDDTELVLVAKSGVDKGAFLEGKYSALFDSNGKLNQTLALRVEQNSDLISYFPEESKLGIGVGVLSPTPKPDPKPTPSPQPTVSETPSLPVNMEYEIVHDLKWLDLVTGEGFSSLDAGEKTVLITNLTDTSFTVVWRSSAKEEGYVKYGTSQTALSEEASDVRDGLSSRNSYYSHTVETKRLDPDTQYYFEIYSGTEKFDNGGKMYSIKTFPLLSTPPPFETKSGVLTNGDTLGDWVLVGQIVDEDEMGTSGSSGYISTIPDEKGDWILTVGDARSQDGSSYFSFSNSDILRMYVLGDSKKLFDFAMSQSNISIDLSTIGSSTTPSVVKLLSDYGIANIK
ncbi:MAG: fibronectin type III domain-containing protein [Candidatus Dojkabacteria bacterium]